MIAYLRGFPNPLSYNLEGVCVRACVCLCNVHMYTVVQLEELRARELQSISQSKSLTDQYTEATLELDNTKKKLANLEKEKTQLDLKVAALQKRLNAASLKRSKPQQNPELTALYKQLQSMLANELSKNSALRDALAAGVST